MPPRPVSNHLIAQLAETRSGNTRANVLEELRRLILSGSVPPGTQIPPAEVAYAFAVSAIPVREALKTLIGEGLVDHRPHGGYNVSLLSVEELHEIYFVRGVLEEAALARAVGKVTDDDLARAHRYHEQLLTATRFRDRKSFHDVSRKFHRQLVLPCAMPRLLNMFESTWNLTEPFQVMRSVSEDIQHTLNDDHAQILDAVAARDADTVLALARSHHARLGEAIVTAEPDLTLRPDQSDGQ